MIVLSWKQNPLPPWNSLCSSTVTENLQNPLSNPYAKAIADEGMLTTCPQQNMWQCEGNNRWKLP